MSISRFSRRASLFLVTAALAVFALSGCGGGGAKDEDDTADSGPEEVIVGTRPDLPPVLAFTPPSTYTDQRAEAFAFLNAQRLAANVGAVLQDGGVDAASTSHGKYLDLNDASGSLEAFGKQGYTGESPVDRLLAAGLTQPTYFTEQTPGRTGTAKQAIETQLSTVYDRAELLDHRPTRVGLGFAGTGTNFVSMLTLPSGATAQGFIGADVDQKVPSHSVYPAVGATGVGLTMANSKPYPAMLGTWTAATPPGFPVSIQFDALANYSVDFFTLVDKTTGSRVTGAMLNKDNDPWLQSAYRHFAFFVPGSALLPGRTYEATVQASVNGRPFTKVWQFTTAN